ncbi:MAG: glycosyltransferase family 4 protein [Cyclobacteriaceae bacterium]|nr:glycosyltransferase family 4 protein [Cyclobacteriaceae bacterium]
MKKILFVVPYPVGAAPSQRFRFEQYFMVLRAQGYSYEIYSFWSGWGWNILYKRGFFIQKILAFAQGLIGRIGLLFIVPKYQYVFIHREVLPVGPPFFEWIIAKIFRKPIIYDFDDAIWLPNTSDQNRVVAAIKNHGKVKKICSWSWKVSCGNGFLADFAREYCEKVIINPTTIDTDYHVPFINTSVPKPLVIGWTGTHSTTRYLLPLVPVFKKLKKVHAFEIRIISNQPPDWDFNDYIFIPWSQSEEIEQLQYFDIGVMPLEDTDWEKGKCGFKALQYMALEIPAVASSVGANREIIDHGINGFLCQNQEDWFTYLEQLIVSEKLRKSIGIEGRKKVLEKYSVHSNASLFLSLFE